MMSDIISNHTEKKMWWWGRGVCLFSSFSVLLGDLLSMNWKERRDDEHNKLSNKKILIFLIVMCITTKKINFIEE